MRGLIRFVSTLGLLAAAGALSPDAIAMGSADDVPKSGGSSGAAAVPEVNGSGVPVALALVLGGAAVVLGRKARRKE